MDFTNGAFTLKVFFFKQKLTEDEAHINHIFANDLFVDRFKINKRKKRCTNGKSNTTKSTLRGLAKERKQTSITTEFSDTKISTHFPPTERPNLISLDFH